MYVEAKMKGLFADLVLASSAALAHADRTQFYSVFQPCPVACSTAPNPEQWTLYSSVERLTRCAEPVLFDVSLFAPLTSISDLTRVRACTVGNPETLDVVNSVIDGSDVQAADAGVITRRVDSSDVCNEAEEKISAAQIASWGAESLGNQDAALELLRQMQAWLQAETRGCQSTAIFGHLDGVFAGFYSGPRVDEQATSEGLVQDFIDLLGEGGVPERTLAQHCGQNLTDATTAGLVIDTADDFVSVQEALRGWSESKCVDGGEKTSELPDTTVYIRPIPKPQLVSRLWRRDQCRFIRVEDGDGCGSLAEKCGITGADYMKYNPAEGHCAGLKAGMPVCCSEGDQPDVRPQKAADGTCASYTVIPGDNCAKLEGYNQITRDELNDFNKNTWGWSGCEPLGLGINICLSDGKPPMPNAQDNAVCGPTKPGSVPPEGDETLSDLNPCPLNVCCNIWGQCGMSDDFCIESESDTGAPGTAKPGTNGCVQNCGTDIKISDSGPSQPRKIGYYEAWNSGRECLNMDVRAVINHKQAYTDIHFSFATITPDFEVEIAADVEEEWIHFSRMTDGPRKILAFGGWAFSTEMPTYEMFRTVTTEPYRDAFAQKCVDFLNKYNLDGLDFDWEYPSAEDIPGIEKGSPEEGNNYLLFLKSLREKLPQGKSLSIAAPASYWYLKGFPIAKMHEHLDYIVYMTYDLHGQWDFGNKWASPGCADGNCLRSHINWTETELALSMITKAGVPTNKLVLGVSTYGRSFKMVDSGCRGPMCTYEDDAAKPGRCTNTSGYIANAEINEIIDAGGPIKVWYDEETMTDFLVYDGYQWVSYMTDNTRKMREAKASELNMVGSTEWAVDLAEFDVPFNLPAGSFLINYPVPRGDDYKEIDCDNKYVKDINELSEVRWDEMHASQAWSGALWDWESRDIGTTRINFTAWVSRFFEGPDDRRCENLAGENGCRSFISCSQVNAPAGMAILNSFSSISNIIYAQYQGLQEAANDLEFMMGNFVEIFAPPKSEDIPVAIIIDLVLIGYSVIGASFWNVALKELKYWKDSSNELSQLKDTVNGVVAGSLSMARTLSRSNAKLETSEELKQRIGEAMMIWRTAIEDFNSKLFNGEDEHINTLTAMLLEGKMMGEATPFVSNAIAREQAKKVFYAMLVPLGWRYSQQDIGPFVLHVPGVSCDKMTTAEAFSKYIIKYEDREKTAVCVDDEAYFIVGAGDPDKLCNFGPDIGGYCYEVIAPPGLDKLGDYMLTKEDIVHGAVNTWKANGKKNDYVELDVDGLGDFEEQDIRAPGLIWLPVCEIDEADDNRLDAMSGAGSSRGPNYPCD